MITERNTQFKINNVKYVKLNDIPRTKKRKKDVISILKDPTHRRFLPQSGTTNDAKIMSMGTGTQQNVEFSDQNESYSYEVISEMDPTRMLQDSSDATLDDFFSRPLKISTTEWGTGLSLLADIDPWSLYFNNPRVANRITNYNLLRANLNIKVVINGNGFQYGRAILSYLPLQNFDDLSTNAGLIPQDLVQASQYPHIYLDPTTSTGGEMKLPFFWHENYLSIPNSDWAEMGQLYLRALTDLKHANGAADKATISVFAWASEVSLSVLTSVDAGTLTPQSGSEVDVANKLGVVSGPATAIAKISNAMSVIPAIKPFAMATSTVASAVAGAAKSMGYCRPAVTANPAPFRAHPISHLAATCVPDTAMKLSVDDKQELSIDPRIAGLGAEDPMSIREIAKRESYLTSFPWQIGTGPETLLWNARVDPVTWAESGTAPEQAFHFPAAAMAALPFTHWTGSMNFRFQIVASSFHKGRIKVVYDPNFLASNEYNTNYLEVIDISDKQDFTISIGNGQTTTLLDHALPGVTSVTEMYSTTVYTTKGNGNGVIGVYVVNELTTPNSEVDNDIEVNVFVSMGDDFEVFVPTNKFQAFTIAPAPPPPDPPPERGGFRPQSGSEIVKSGDGLIPESQNTMEPSAPQQTMSSDLGPGKQDNALINTVFTGEAITSFRTLLKRYNLHRSFLLTSQGFPDILWQHHENMFPYYRGYVAGAVNTSVGLVPYNYCNTLLLHWVVLAHQGWRGGIRTKLLLKGDIKYQSPGTNPTQSMYVERKTAGSLQSTYLDSLSALPAFANRNDPARAAVYNDSFIGSNVTGTLGALFVDGHINGNAEWENPWYNKYRFSPGKTVNVTTGSPVSEGWELIYEGATNNTRVVDFHNAIAEDFQVYMFTGLPRMYYEQSPPEA